MGHAGEELRQHPLQRRSTRSTPATSAAQGRLDVLDRRRRAATKRRRSSSASTMYVVTPFPNIVYALDLSQARRAGEVEVRAEAAVGGAGRRLLRRRQPRRRVLRTARSSSTRSTARRSRSTRRPARRSGAPSSATSTGARRSRWRRSSSRARCWSATAAASSACAAGSPRSTRASGKIAWRAYSTGPDKDVLIGPHFKPFYAQDRGKDLGVTTWPAGRVEDRRRHGVGLDLATTPSSTSIYYGTAQSRARGIPEQRPGDNKWTSGIFARDADTGEARWVYQWSPHDLYDYDGVNENVLLDLPIERHARARCSSIRIATATSTCIDRATGEVLSAEPVRARHVEQRRRPQDRAARFRSTDKTPRAGERSCATSARPRPARRTGSRPRSRRGPASLYIPHNNLCMDVGGDRGQLHRRHAVRRRERADVRRARRQPRRVHGLGSRRRGKRSGRSKENFPVWSGAVVDGGRRRLLRHDGRLVQGGRRAHRRRSLWQFKTGSGIIGQPITYRGPDGKQYVAVFSGVGGWAGAVVVDDLDPRDPDGRARLRQRRWRTCKMDTNAGARSTCSRWKAK